ncbi:MAG: ABC transporter ATP-binding protein [Deltaproteobacteria bacterium]|nr:ABC transporter ATP-binding protein [Deltaproteobacteria bacterium]
MIAHGEHDALVQIRRLTKTYGEGEAAVTVLRALDLDIEAGRIVALCGPSGSGKSTLLNIIGCLDRPSSGTYHLKGQDMSTLDRTAQAAARLTYLGFIFQSFHLLPDITALENVMLPLQYAGVPLAERRARAESMLARVELADRMNHRPNQLSGGQKQRVAIARACVSRPRLLLADEPTGALDTRTGRAVLDLLEEIHKEEALTIVIVTHDNSVAAWAHQRIDLRDGRIVSAESNAPSDHHPTA